MSADLTWLTIKDTTCKCGRIHTFANEGTCPDCSRYADKKKTLDEGTRE